MFDALQYFGDAAAASDSLRAGLVPVLSTISVIASAAFLLFLIIGGIYYMTARDNFEKLQHAKAVLTRGTLGFIIVIAASFIGTTLTSVYGDSPTAPAASNNIKFEETEQGGFNIGNEIIRGFIAPVIEQVGKPIFDVISKFLINTPLMAQTPSVFNLWKIILAMAVVLLVLVISLIGFSVMSGKVLGTQDGNLRAILPQIFMAFGLMTTSIFAIDFLITICNAMVNALNAGTGNIVVISTLKGLLVGTATLPIGGLVLLLVLVILAVMLLIYYLMRIITLYIGAVLSPMVVLLWLIPSFRDFAVMAARQYIVTIFILFVHLVILSLAAYLFEGVGGSNSVMATLLGIACVAVLISSSKVLNQMVGAAGSVRSAKQLGTAFRDGSRGIAKAISESPGVKVGKKAASATNTIGIKAAVGGGSALMAAGAAGGRFMDFNNFRNNTVPTVAAKQLTKDLAKDVRAQKKAEKMTEIAQSDGVAPPTTGTVTGKAASSQRNKDI